MGIMSFTYQNGLLKYKTQTFKYSVFPAKAGIQRISSKFGHWILAFAGMTGVLV